MSYYSKSHNPFADSDDEEEPSVRKGNKGTNDWENAEEDRQTYLRQEVLHRANSTLESTNRSLAAVYESEHIGADAAQELLRQGESLRRTERMVDKMEQDLKTSQRHINSIKSVFGGIVNYFKSKPEPVTPPDPTLQPSGNIKLQEAIESSRAQESNYQASHPNLRKLDTSGFGRLDGGSTTASSGTDTYPKNPSLRMYHQKVDENLDEMSSGLSRLKNLALGLQSEIDDQDVIIDRLTPKVETLDSHIVTTTKTIRKL